MPPTEVPPVDPPVTAERPAFETPVSPAPAEPSPTAPEPSSWARGEWPLVGLATVLVVGGVALVSTLYGVVLAVAATGRASALGPGAGLGSFLSFGWLGAAVRASTTGTDRVLAFETRFLPLAGVLVPAAVTWAVLRYCRPRLRQPDDVVAFVAKVSVAVALLVVVLLRRQLARPGLVDGPPPPRLVGRRDEALRHQLARRRAGVLVPDPFDALERLDLGPNVRRRCVVLRQPLPNVPLERRPGGVDVVHAVGHPVLLLSPGRGLTIVRLVLGRGRAGVRVITFLDPPPGD